MKRLIAMVICSCVLFAGIELSAAKPEPVKKGTEKKVVKKGGLLEKKCGCTYRKRKGKKKERIVKKCDGCKKATAKKAPVKKCKKGCTCAKCKKAAPTKKCGKGCTCAKCGKSCPKSCAKGCKCAKCAKKAPKKTPKKGPKKDKGVEVIILPDVERDDEIPRFIEKEKENPKAMEKGSEKVQEVEEEESSSWWIFW